MSARDLERDAVQERLKAFSDPLSFFTNLFAHAPVGLAVWNAAGYARLTNQRFRDIFLSEPPPDFNVLKDEQLAASGMLPLFQLAFSGETVHVPTFWYDPRAIQSVEAREGRRVAISMTLFPLFDASGQLEYVAATYQDETEITLRTERIKQSEERLRLAQQVARIGTFEWDVQADVNTWTPELELMHGLQSGDFARTQQSWLELVHPDDREGAKQRVSLAFQTFEPVEGEWRVVWPNGNVRFILGRFQVFQDDEGKPQRLVGVNLDITDRKQAAARLRVLAETSRHFSVAMGMDTLPELIARCVGEVIGDTCAIHLIAPDGVMLEAIAFYHPDPEVNAQVRRVTRENPLRLGESIAGRVAQSGQPMLVPTITLEQALAVTSPAYHPFIERLGVRSVLAVPLKTGERVIGALSLIRVDDRKPYNRDDQSLAEDLADRAAMAITNAQLLTDLRESDARKAAVMEAALDAILLMDADGNISDFNAAAEAIFGYTRAEAVGKPLAELIVPEELRARHRAGLQRYLDGGAQQVLGQRLELPALKKDGTTFPAEVAIVRIRSAGAPIFTGYIRDITERKRAQEAEMFRRAKDAAEAANAELEAFSYSVAHDLRAPLRGINGFSSMLLEDHGEKLNEEAREQLRRITTSAERMGQIIDTLLSLARLTRAELRRERIDLVPIAATIVDELRATEPQRNVELVTPPRLFVEGDASMLRVVLENLLGNAWKFTRGAVGARIELGTTLSPEGTACFVRDNGAGFNMAYASKLFMPFQRLHSPEQFEGTGVGLATVQRIVRRHGGRIWAESTERGGATFHFTLAKDAGKDRPSWAPAS